MVYDDDGDEVSEEDVADSYLQDETGYTLKEIERMVEKFDNDQLIDRTTIKPDETLIIDLEHNWIDHPERIKESEKMMKLVCELDNGKLYIDLRHRLVFVPID